jgi:hypothetical protein
MGIFNIAKADEEKFVDIHHDFEFVDAGAAGLPTVSIGAVICSGSKLSYLYGIDSTFFETTMFLDLCRTKNKQNDWLFENMFVHIRVRLDKELKSISLNDARGRITKNTVVRLVAADQRTKEMDALGVQIVVGTQAAIRRKLVQMVSASTTFKKPEVRQWCYYSAHDTVCFNNLFGGMLHKPDNYSNYAIDIRVLSDVFGQKHDDFNPAAKHPHHPLFDALAQYETALKLQELVLKKNSVNLGRLVSTPAEYQV